MRTFANKIAIERVMRMQARIKLSVRFSIRKLLPLMKIFEEPVTDTLMESFFDLSIFFKSTIRFFCFRFNHIAHQRIHFYGTDVGHLHGDAHFVVRRIHKRIEQTAVVALPF